MKPSVSRVILFATASAENGHKVAVSAIQEIARRNGLIEPPPPVLDMGLRMGEATAALLAVPILRSAAKMLSSMGTIEDILSN